MEAVLTPHATAQKQPFAPNKNIRMKTPKKNGRGNFICANNRSENFDTYAGLLNPPSRAMSFSYSHPLSASSLFTHHCAQQPPLLPLPHVVSPTYGSGQGLVVVVNKNKNRSRDMSLTPKKSKPTKREEAKKRSVTQSDNRWGPDPKDLPKVVLGMGNNHHDVVSGAVFNLAPPPSSLPLPKFSLRSKLGCNAETAAGGVDDGATNNLRRLLRLW
ncbi:hypothetical protein JHK87_008708 [Glycine soja]|nr:hypothetical protein JHK87_008708 [Glycine soja]